MLKSRNKKLSTLVGLMLVAVILLTGTYAWQNFGQRAFNPMYGTANLGGRIHDDFERVPGDDPTRGAGLFDKSVYGENFGQEPLQLRVRLSEFLRIDGGDADGYGVGGADINDPSTWPIFTTTPAGFGANNAFTRADVASHAGAVQVGQQGNVQWALGDAQLAGSDASNVPGEGANRGQRFFMPTHNQLTRELTATEVGILETDNPARPYFANTQAYRFADTTGRGVDALALGEAPVLPGATEPNVNADHARDFYDLGVVTGMPGQTGGHNQWTATSTFASTLMRTVGTELIVEAATMTARPTLAPTLGGVMTVGQWQDEGFPAGNFWILNPATGWFYWNGTLDAEEATSLLLNAINVNPVGAEWEYVIHIDSDWWRPGHEPEGATPEILVVLSPMSVTVNDANLNVTTTVGGSGAITLNTAALPAGVTASVSGNVVNVEGVRPAYGQPAITGAFVVPVMRMGVTRNLTVNVNLTPELAVPYPLPPLPQPYPAGPPIIVGPGGTYPYPETPGPVAGFDSAIFTLEPRVAVGYIHPGITVNAETGQVTIPADAPDGHEFYLVLTVTLDGETASERCVIRVERGPLSHTDFLWFRRLVPANIIINWDPSLGEVGTGSFSLEVLKCPITLDCGGEENWVVYNGGIIEFQVSNVDGPGSAAGLQRLRDAGLTYWTTDNRTLRASFPVPERGYFTDAEIDALEADFPFVQITHTWDPASLFGAPTSMGFDNFDDIALSSVAP